MEKDWLFAGDGYICDLRTVAVLVKDGKLLVQRDRDGQEYALPGGHVKIGETLEAGLIREAREELGVEISANASCGVKNAFGNGRADRPIISPFTTRWKFVTVTKFPTMGNLCHRKITAMSSLAGCLLRS